MIFVTVGTQPNGFLRCIRQVEELVEKGYIKEEVIAQIGHTPFTTQKFKCIPFLSENQFKEFISQASAVITHAGSGAIFNAIKAGKKTIAVARLHELNEMADDHQTELVKKLAAGNYILDGTSSLQEAWEKLEQFEPKPADFECNIISILDEYIQSVL